MYPIKTLLVGAALSIATLGAAHAADPKVGKIDVSVKFSSVDANALQFYPDLEADLEARLAEELAPVMADGGGQMIVIVTDLGVDGNAILASASDINTLQGGVQFFPAQPDGSNNPKVTDIKVVAVPEMPVTVPADAPYYLILPSDGTVYDVMLDKFAEVVAERLPDMK